MNLMSATPETLLTVPLMELWAGLGHTSEEAQHTWRQLAQRWHPDRSREPQASAVFARLASAHRTWRPKTLASALTLATAAGTVLTLHHRHAFDHELGQTHVGQGHVLELYASPHADLGQSAATHLTHLPFLTPAMRNQMGLSLPSQAVSHLLADGRVALVFTKAAGLLRLADVVHHVGLLDPRHVAWIGSGLWNLACYLQAVGWTHQAIQADTVWVDPATHRVALLGGWAYAGPEGTPWTALPAASVQAASLAVRAHRRHAAVLDHELIQALLRQLLPPASPAALLLSARLPAGGTAVEQYRAWKQALHTSFGPPAFVPWDLSPTTLYPEN